MAYWRQNCTAFFYEINPDEEFDMIYQQSALLPRSISNHILVKYLSIPRQRLQCWMLAYFVAHFIM